MFSLNDPLENTVIINGQEHELHMAFDNVLDALGALKDEELTELSRIELFFEIMLQSKNVNETVPLECIENTFKDIMNVINIQKGDSLKVDINGDPMPVSASKEKEQDVISFEIDAPFIYAGFLQAYGIDLIDQQGILHWYKFSALLSSLPDDTLMRQIIDIRKTNLSDIKDKEEKKRIRKLKKQFALSNSEQDEDETE